MTEDLDRSYREHQAEYDARLLDLASECSTCHGHPRTCPWCRGSNMLRGLNASSAQKVGPPNCWHCNGGEWSCPACNGTGIVVPPVLARNPEALAAARACLRPDVSAAADEEQRKCKFIMWRGNITGRLITCGVCEHCRRSEEMRAGRD